MLFARRAKPTLTHRLREALWPRRGFRRAAKYIGYRVMRLPGTPHSISGGVAWGVSVSVTPFLGLHFLLAVFCAWLTRCSVIASAIGTVVGNPWTFPLIWAWTYQCGIWMLGRDVAAKAPPLHSLGMLFSELWYVLGRYIQAAVGLKSMGEAAAPVAWGDLGQMAHAVLWPMVVGSIPNFLVVWFAFYVGFKYLVVGYRRTRAARRSGRAGLTMGPCPMSDSHGRPQGS